MSFQNETTDMTGNEEATVTRDIDEIEDDIQILSYSESCSNLEVIESIEGVVAKDSFVYSCASGEILEYGITPEPNQPQSQEMFPKRMFGKKKPQFRSFQCSWFNNLLWSKWPHWEEKIDKAYCIICRNVHILNQLTSKNQESAFIIVGYNNWKDATRAFELHRKSTCHKEAIMKWDYYLKRTCVHTQICHQLVSEQEKARICLMKILTSVEYLARQGMPFRGHQEDSGNFYQLL